MAADRHSHEPSRYSLACCLREGRGTPKDAPKALLIFRELADNKHAGGTYALALMLRSGEGADAASPASALPLFQRLAEANIAPAMHILGTMLAVGEGAENGTKDEAAAAAWFRRGAALGDPLCTLALAVYTCSGRGGILQDDGEGFRLHGVAAQAGLPQAQFNLGCHYFAGERRRLLVAHWSAQFVRARERCSYSKRSMCAPNNVFSMLLRRARRGSGPQKGSAPVGQRQQVGVCSISPITSW